MKYSDSTCRVSFNFVAEKPYIIFAWNHLSWLHSLVANTADVISPVARMHA